MVRSHGYGVQPLHQFAKPAANAIALGGGAVLFGNGKAYTDRTLVVPAAGLDRKAAKVGPGARACGRAGGAGRDPCGRRGWRGGRGSRDGACAPVCWVDKSASRGSSPLT